MCDQDLISYTSFFEVPGRKYLNENPYYQQLSGEKKNGNASESGVELSKFVFHILQSYLRDCLKFQVVIRFNRLVEIIN